MNFGRPNVSHHRQDGSRSTFCMSDSRSPVPPPQKPLVQKLEAALQSLRRDRDQEYREKAEAEERLRLAEEEKQAISKVVANLESKISKLIKDKETVKVSLSQLDEQVRDLSEKAQFQHNELIGARGKIQQKTREMEEKARDRRTRLEAIRQTAHQRRLKANDVEKQLEQATIIQSKKTLGIASSKKNDAWLKVDKQKESLERELNCLVFEWESFPKFLKEKRKLYWSLAKKVGKLNDDLAQELIRCGVALSDEEKGVGASLDERMTEAAVSTIPAMDSS